METIVSAKKFKLSPELKDYADNKFTGLKKYFANILEVDVVLSLQRKKVDNHICEVTMWINGSALRAKSVSENNFRESVDAAYNKIESQLKKYKSKIKDRSHSKSIPQTDYQVMHRVIETDEDYTKRSIVRSQEYEVKPMIIEEAAEQLELLSQDFLVFQNAESKRINVIYRRHDGNFGLIEPGNY